MTTDTNDDPTNPTTQEESATMETPTNDPTTPTTTNPITHEESASLRRLIARAGRTYDLVIARALEEAEMDDLPMRGISVLRRISSHTSEANAGTPLADVLRGGRISRQHGTQLIDTLVERGYIVRETDPEDRRRMRVALTERGAAAAEAVRAAIDSLNASLQEQVSAEQLAATQAVLAALIELAPEGAEPDAGWGPGPGRGFDPRGFGGPRGRGHGPHEHGPGRGHGRGPGRGPRGPMRDFAEMAAFREGREGGHFRERMQAFAADDADSAPEADERAPWGPDRDGRGRGHEHGRGRCHRRHDHHRGEGRGAAPMVHIDTVIVQAGTDSRRRGDGKRHSRRHEQHGGDRGQRSFGPWSREERGHGQDTPAVDATPTE